MNLQEVLQIVKDNEWFRPVGWKGFRRAFIIKENRIYWVPSAQGGAYGFVNDVRDLLDDWEIVTPDQVLDGL